MSSVGGEEDKAKEKEGKDGGKLAEGIIGA